MVRLIKWVQLSSGRMKTSIDGACIKGVNASYEGLVKDEEGYWMRCFSKKWGSVVVTWMSYGDYLKD